MLLLIPCVYWFISLFSFVHAIFASSLSPTCIPNQISFQKWKHKPEDSSPSRALKWAAIIIRAHGVVLIELRSSSIRCASFARLSCDFWKQSSRSCAILSVRRYGNNAWVQCLRLKRFARGSEDILWNLR